MIEGYKSVVYRLILWHETDEMSWLPVLYEKQFLKLLMAAAGPRELAAAAAVDHVICIVPDFVKVRVLMRVGHRGSRVSARRPRAPHYPTRR
jgi:hypothetical protein